MMRKDRIGQNDFPKGLSSGILLKYSLNPIIGPRDRGKIDLAVKSQQLN